MFYPRRLVSYEYTLLTFIILLGHSFHSILFETDIYLLQNGCMHVCMHENGFSSAKMQHLPRCAWDLGTNIKYLPALETAVWSLSRYFVSERFLVVFHRGSLFILLRLSTAVS